ncbi:TBC1 domain family member 7-like isoform X2 [Orbicella faveolata]|uniref:TBC1 domain family member 7-like isoform X2 n=1 Tax=Orbicella faveolata TaxID=48498 RepID=UPI0009E284F6|nr:TBC1 domain family member 7-like isoform X2 [Orbicella faveolata]
MVDKDGRNFRAFYYDTLGLRNVEQRKALEILLKDDPIDVERISTFSTRFSLPAVYRNHVWKVILGVIPPYQDAHKFVIQQRSEHFNDLRHALKVMRKISDDDDIPYQMSMMYLLDEGALRFVKIPKKLERKAKIMSAVVHVFADMFEDEVDLYWISFKFMKCLDQSGTQMEKLEKLTQHYLQTEDAQLHKHLLSIDTFDVLPLKRWFESGFTEDIPDSCMERIWDKVVCGSSKILVFVAVGLLMVYRHPLLMEKSSQGVDKFFCKHP